MLAERETKSTSSKSNTGSRAVLAVSEIFSSLQGEGPYSGTPAAFLRLAFCNLHCWFCDTKYSWLFHQKLLNTVKGDLERLGVKASPADLIVHERSKEATEMAVEEVKTELLKTGKDHLVITGGEPMLQQSALFPLIQDLKSNRDFFIEVETSGTLAPNFGMREAVDAWNVSPKLESSGNPSSLREKPRVLTLFSELANATFKFVVQTPEDLREVEGLVERYSIPRNRVMLMPEGTDAGTLQERSAWLLKACSDSGFRFSSRLHILLWGNKRGV